MKVLNIGSMNLDHVYQVDHIVQPGETEASFDMNVFLSFPLYLSKYIPGYAWGMVLNKMQTSLIENLDELKSDSCFYHIEKLENGSHYFQMTPDVRKMKKEEEGKTSPS